MVTVYYRTNAAIARNPLAFVLPEEGLDRSDYEVVHTFQDGAAGELEEVFAKMNVVEGNELPVRLKIRSMMPGDVVVDEDGDLWFCGAVGWRFAGCNW